MNKIGYFDLRFKYASDLDFIIRCFNKKEIKKKYYNMQSVNMLSGGKSTKNFINIIKQNIECIKILNKNKINYSFFNFIFSKILNRLSQIL